MSDPQTVNLRRDGAAATIELNRPEALNAWNGPLGTELLAAVRAVVTTGAGRASSSGADLKDVSSREERTTEAHPNPQKVLTERYHPIIAGLRRMPKRVVAPVNGPAVGIGLSLALAADLVV